MIRYWHQVQIYWHTLRYLRPIQIYGRLWFRLYRPKPDLRPAPQVRSLQGRWMPSVAKPVSMLGPFTFRFLNETHELAAGGRDPWNDPARDRLWLYNLHYFDDLSAVGSGERGRLHLVHLARWVAENAPGQGTGWEPYPTSLRIVNWIKWALAFSPQPGAVPAALPPSCLHSLAVQARWLARRLEHHLLGNHLVANAKALVFAGAFFVGSEADRWRRLGLRLLTRELAEQILPDGGHCERSPMYHAILLEDVLDVINLAGAYPGLFGAVGSGTAEAAVSASQPAVGAPWGGERPQGHVLTFLRAKATSMQRWLEVMCHPDGEISFFNDAAFGIAPTLAELMAYGARLGMGVQRREAGETPALNWLRDCGYIRLEAGPAVVLLDVAPIGPDHLPGHAHADTLSFELSLFGQRVIVNGGTSRYGSGPARLAERGTAAHSTVQIDGVDSSEVWGGFRVARRARPMALSARYDDVNVPVASGALRLQVTAAHDGYRRLPGRPVHRRTWGLAPGSLSVSDTLDGGFVTAVARFHLHPAVAVTCDEASLGGTTVASATMPRRGSLDTPGSQCGDSEVSSCGRMRLPGGHDVQWQVSGGRARVVADQWHPEFGLSVPSHCLEVTLDGGRCRLNLSWAHDQGPDAAWR